MRLRGAIYGLTAASSWGGVYVITDVVLQTIPPFTLLTIRLILGSLLLTVVVRRLKLPFPPRRDIIRVLMLGAFGFAVAIGAQFFGTDKSTAVNGALITSASPAFILLFAAVILRERLTLSRIGAVALATLGVLVIIDPTRADFTSDAFTGNLALGLTAVLFGLYSVLVRRLSARLDTLLVTYLVFVGALLFTIPVSLLELTQRPIGVIDMGTILGIAYLGIVSTVALWLWNRAFALVEASVASLFFFAQPLVGALLSVLILGQQMTLALWAGGTMIILGVLLSILAPERRASAEPVIIPETGD